MDTLKVQGLSCEYRQSPLGLDVRKPRFGWKLFSSGRNVRQSGYQVQVALGGNWAEGEFVWDSQFVDSSASVQVEYDGRELLPCTRYDYRVKVWTEDGRESEWSEPSSWETGLMEPANWQAEWIGTEEAGTASPYLRHGFSLGGGALRQARAYITAHGLYQLQVNGETVSDDLFTPGWTSYHNRLQYQVYDLTSQLAAGDNVLGVVLGNGWYKGNLAWSDWKELYGSQLAVLMQVHVQYEDGREEVICTGDGWRWSTGPILMSEIYHGETYDARLELDGWSAAGYDDSGWQKAKVFEFPLDHIVAQENLPCRVMNELEPIAVIHTPKGETVLDLGQNMVGWVWFSVKGREGAELVLQHAEVLDAAGNFYTGNLRAAKQTVRYVSRGADLEIYEPSFTFQGFRYLKLEGDQELMDSAKFIGKVIHTDMKQTGLFECSDPLVNQLQHNILWGQKGNFLDVPTDCPQRDERLGWTGDAQMFIRTAAFNMNVASFFTKWLRDLKADQFADGGVPHVVPDVLSASANQGYSAAWGDAAVICPWTLYLCYGDVRILDEQFDSMRSWVEYIRAQGDDPYLWNTGAHFGDWLALDAKENSYVGATPREFIATAFYAYSCKLLSKAARVLQRDQEAAEYEELYVKVRDSFRDEFVTSRGRLASHTQTAHLLALMFDLVEHKHRSRVAADLEKLIRDEKQHLTTGFVGTPYLCHVLSANGRTELAYELLLQRDYPSWLYAVDKGATTIWEHWDGIKPDGSFWSDSMNSYNHYAYGAIGDWLYRTVAGIDAVEDAPGYKRLLLAPQPGGGFSWVNASLETMYGTVSSRWQLEKLGQGAEQGSGQESEQGSAQMRLELEIPANTTAVVVLPVADATSVIESGRSLEQVEEILVLADDETDAAPSTGAQATGVQTSGVRLELGSGNYVFEFPYSGFPL